MTDVVHHISQEGRWFWFAKHQGNGLTSWHQKWRHLKRAFFEDGCREVRDYYRRSTGHYTCFNVVFNYLHSCYFFMLSLLTVESNIPMSRAHGGACSTHGCFIQPVNTTEPVKLTGLSRFPCLWRSFVALYKAQTIVMGKYGKIIKVKQAVNLDLWILKRKEIKIRNRKTCVLVDWLQLTCVVVILKKLSDTKCGAGTREEQQGNWMVNFFYFIH